MPVMGVNSHRSGGGRGEKCYAIKFCARLPKLRQSSLPLCKSQTITVLQRTPLRGRVRRGSKGERQWVHLGRGRGPGRWVGFYLFLCTKGYGQERLTTMNTEGSTNDDDYSSTTPTTGATSNQGNHPKPDANDHNPTVL